MHLSGYARVARFPVAYADVDMNRHANNVAYLRWAEQGRVDYVREVLQEEIGGRQGLILRKTEIVYDRPLAYAERVVVGTRVSRIGTKSLLFVCDIVSEETSLRSALALCTCVAYDYGANVSIAVPAEWTRRIVALEPVLPEGA